MVIRSFFMTKKISEHILEIVVFICGASLMILELVGSRVLAPYVGTSTIVWTSLIGIILGFLSLGYWWGGKIADKNPSERVLSLLIFLAAFFVFSVIISNSYILYFIRERIDSVYLGAVLGTIILFSVPSLFLGTVSPYAVKLKMKNLDSSGRTVGNLYAVSTLGSIAGTFSAGFFLIPFLGTTKILYLISILLVFSSILVSFKHYLRIKAISLFLYLICAFMSLSFNATVHADELIDIDTPYSRIWIYPSKAPNVPRPILRLTTDPFSVQSAMFLDRDDDLVYRYSKFYRLAEHFNPDIEKALMIGGAAYSYPKDFLRHYPNAEITVVEIDPKMTEAAKRYFKLPKDPRLKIVHKDGRVFLNNNNKEFDAIYMDAFTSHLSIPHQLTTLEAVEELYDSLEDEGVLITNIASALSGEKSKFLRAQLATYKEIFPQVYVFVVDKASRSSVQNLILIALKSEKEPELRSDDQEYDKLLRSLWTGNIKQDLPLLTDEYAPVDHYVKDFID